MAESSEEARTRYTTIFYTKTTSTEIGPLHVLHPHNWTCGTVCVIFHSIFRPPQFPLRDIQFVVVVAAWLSTSSKWCECDDVRSRTPIHVASSSAGAVKHITMGHDHHKSQGDWCPSRDLQKLSDQPDNRTNARSTTTWTRGGGVLGTIFHGKREPSARNGSARCMLSKYTNCTACRWGPRRRRRRERVGAPKSEWMNGRRGGEKYYGKVPFQ